GAGERVGEIDVAAVETVEQDAPTDQTERVPAHVRDAPRAESLDAAGEEAEPGAALFALLEQKLHAEADAEHRSSGGGSVAQGIGQATSPEAAGGASGVADAGDHGERRLAHADRVGRHRGIRSHPLEAGADTAQVAGAVVDEGDHSVP